MRFRWLLVALVLALILALEKQERKMMGERLDFEKETNAELNRQNKLIEEQNRELQQLVTARDKLQSVISHDLRNPFTIIQSLTESLSENLDHLEEEDIKKAVSTIFDTNRRGLYLLDNLLNWTRLQNDKLKVVKTSIPVFPVVRQMMEYFDHQLAGKNLIFNNKAEYAVSICCDEDMFRTILRNLISNGIKFTPEGGAITVTASTSDGRTAVCVADTGMGINGNNLKRITTLNESFSTPGTFGEKGSGLGLSLVREFVEMNHGSFEVRSEEGKGTEVCMEFPESPEK